MPATSTPMPIKRRSRGQPGSVLAEKLFGRYIVPMVAFAHDDQGDIYYRVLATTPLVPDDRGTNRGNQRERVTFQALLVVASDEGSTDSSLAAWRASWRPISATSGASDTSSSFRRSV